MSKNQCFKIKRGTEYDKAVKGHFSLLPKWENVFAKVGELLGEEITRLGFTTENLLLVPDELSKDENKKLFKQDGYLKNNTKKAKSVFHDYQKIIEDLGLSEWEELRFINFKYGAMRMRGQNLESFRTSEDDIYYKADFDLEEKTNGMVTPISLIEYEEKYLEELKKQEVTA
jgi:hypothetical protein